MVINFKWFFILMSLIFCLIGCNRDAHFEDLQQYVQRIKQAANDQQKKVAIAPLTFPKPVRYQGTGKRIPFTGHEIAQFKPNVANPLQAYAVTMLRFVGTVTKGDSIYAYIVTPNNTVFEVKQGDSIGDRNGRIIEILPDRINIREGASSPGKPTMQSIVTLELRKTP